MSIPVFIHAFHPRLSALNMLSPEKLNTIKILGTIEMTFAKNTSKETAKLKNTRIDASL